MSASPVALMADIRDKIAALAAERDKALGRVAELEEKISGLQNELDDARANLHRARLDVDFLTVSHRLADTPEALVLARKTIAALIRKVESAIALVKNDPAEI